MGLIKRWDKLPIFKKRMGPCMEKHHQLSCVFFSPLRLCYLTSESKPPKTKQKQNKKRGANGGALGTSGGPADGEVSVQPRRALDPGGTRAGFGARKSSGWLNLFPCNTVTSEPLASDEQFPSKYRDTPYGFNHGSSFPCCEKKKNSQPFGTPPYGRPGRPRFLMVCGWFTCDEGIHHMFQPAVHGGNPLCANSKRARLPPAKSDLFAANGHSGKVEG